MSSRPKQHTFYSSGRDGESSPPPTPPVRDSSSLKSIKYGPGHEKFPSWPVPSAAETPIALRVPPSGGSHRSKSWTDHTNYPKEKVVTYTRPYMKRQHSSNSQQKLKTVMEKCEKLPQDPRYLPPEPSPQMLPERETPSLLPNFPPSLTHENFIKYESTLLPLHSKQPSYAQSEGYHSYTSTSTDPTSTPFLDRLRRDSEITDVRMRVHTPDTTWYEQGRESVVTTSSSTSSSETLKWHGSMSDVSVGSGGSNKQLIVHSARVQTPQRHHSESVLFVGGGEGWGDEEARRNNANKLKLFAVNTYTVEEPATSGLNRWSHNPLPQDKQPDIDHSQKFSHHFQNKLPSPNLKAIQKKALLSFYERHQSNWRSEPHLAAKPSPHPPPKPKPQTPHRRASSASDYITSKRPIPKTTSSGHLRPITSSSHLGSSVTSSSHLVSTTSTGHLGSSVKSSGHSGSVTSSGHIGSVKSPGHLGSPVTSSNHIASTVTSSNYIGSSNTSLDHLGSITSSRHSELITSSDYSGSVTSSSYIGSAKSSVQLRSPVNSSGHLGLMASSDILRCDTTFSGHLRPKTLPLGPETSEGYLRHVTSTSGIVTSSDHLGSVTSPSGHLRPLTSTSDHLGSVTSSSHLTGLLGPVILGPSISVDDWIPERPPDRPPKTPHLRSCYPDLFKDQRIPSPDLPPPSPPTVLEDEVFFNDEPLPPPPSEFDTSPSNWEVEFQERLKDRSKDHLIRSFRMKNRLISGCVAVSEKIINCQQRSEPLGISTSGRGQRSSIAEMSFDPPPPLQPRQMRTNQSMRIKSNFGLRSRDSIGSQSKASYLASRRDRERIVPDSDTGSYKRTISPNGHVILPPPPTTNNNNNNSSTNIIRRASMNDKPRKQPQEQQENVDVIILPDVLPMNVKTSRYSSTSCSLRKLSLLPDDTDVLVDGGDDCCGDVVHRTEVTLNVNVCTTDAASQTEKEEEVATSRRKLQEEIDCEMLSRDFVRQLPTADRLKDILVQAPEFKKPTDYVNGLFKLESTRSRSRSSTNSPFSRATTPTSTTPPPISISKSTTPNNEISTVPMLESVSPLSANSPYFTTSEPKARFLTRFSQDMNQFKNIVKDTKDLNQKKDELVSRLDRKLQVLRSEQLVVFEECRINEELGENVSKHFAQLARPQEISKFRLHVEEVGKITSLLLGLSGRLARAENALMTMLEDHPEKTILENKRDKLLQQLEEAKVLKTSIDKRGATVSTILYKYLTSEQYADYDHFINMKAKLIMDSKEIADKIKLGEEQLCALKETLITKES